MAAMLSDHRVVTTAAHGAWIVHLAGTTTALPLHNSIEIDRHAMRHTTSADYRHTIHNRHHNDPAGSSVMTVRLRLQRPAAHRARTALVLATPRTRMCHHIRVLTHPHARHHARIEIGTIVDREMSCGTTAIGSTLATVISVAHRLWHTVIATVTVTVAAAVLVVVGASHSHRVR